MRRQSLFKSVRIWLPVLAAVAVLLAMPNQARAETFTANATVKPAKGAEASAPLTATVQTFSTEADRETLMAAIKKGGTAARDMLSKRPTIGSIVVAGKSTPIKFAGLRPAGSGRLITLVTAEPIHFVVGDHPDTKAKAGYELGVVLIDLSASPAHGEAALAAKVKIDAQGAIVIDDYGDDVVRLTNVSSK